MLIPAQDRPAAATSQGDLAVGFDQLIAALGTRDKADMPCPACGPDRRHAVNRRRGVLRLWRRDPDFIGYHCARCGARGWAKRGGQPAAPPRREPRRNAPAPLADNGYTFHRAMEMWREAHPAEGSIVATYLRSRGIVLARLPRTLRALASPPAMIAAFDALSVHMATGLGTWAAGAASFLPKLASAVPRYTSAITIVADTDKVGQRFAAELARLLATDRLAIEVMEP
jgi:hypothetical protein